MQVTLDVAPSSSADDVLDVLVEDENACEGAWAVHVGSVPVTGSETGSNLKFERDYKVYIHPSPSLVLTDKYFAICEIRVMGSWRCISVL